MKKRIIIAICLATGIASAVSRPAAMFTQIDTDKDGKATVQELDVWFKARAEKTGVPMKPTVAQAHMKLLDANGDGVLTVEEWTADR